MAGHRKKYDRSVWQSLALISQLGITMVVPTALMFAVGYYADRLLGTSFLAVLLFFVGALAGFRSVYVLVRQIYGSRDGDGK